MVNILNFEIHYIDYGDDEPKYVNCIIDDYIDYGYDMYDEQDHLYTDDFVDGSDGEQKYFDCGNDYDYFRMMMFTIIMIVILIIKIILLWMMKIMMLSKKYVDSDKVWNSRCKMYLLL
jgi:hypothetical protein